MEILASAGDADLVVVLLLFLNLKAPRAGTAPLWEVATALRKTAVVDKCLPQLDPRVCYVDE